MDNIIVSIKIKIERITYLLNTNDIRGTINKYNVLFNEYEKSTILLDLYHKYSDNQIELKEINSILTSPNDSIELKYLAKQEKDNITFNLNYLENEIKNILIENPNKFENNAIMEIRSGSGGNESCIFVENILRMYTMYFKYKGWTYTIISSTNLIGYKEVILNIKGYKIYDNLKYESGVHRVQRIPYTESQGRVHTSAIKIVVFPIIEDINTYIYFKDIKRETFRSSGAGGQHVNKTESSVRLTHIPTGISVECQEERSQHKNYEKAMTVLRYRLYKIEMDKKLEEKTIKIKSLVSTVDRSAKIRTYNFAHNRVTDHRINKSLYYLEDFMNGKLQEMIDALKAYENREN